MHVSSKMRTNVCNLCMSAESRCQDSCQGSKDDSLGCLAAYHVWQEFTHPCITDWEAQGACLLHPSLPLLSSSTSSPQPCRWRRCGNPPCHLWMWCECTSPGPGALQSSSLHVLFWKIYPQIQALKQASMLGKNMHEDTCLTGKHARVGINIQGKVCCMEKD